MNQKQKITGEITISSATLAKTRGIYNIADLKRKIGEFSAERTSEILEILFWGAVILDVSDIHIEPGENQAKIRLRLDGILQDLLEFPKQNFEPILSRVKLLSGLKLNVTDRPQDGRFSVEAPKTPAEKGEADMSTIEVRTSTLPAEYGESVVLRLLNPKSLIKLEALGLRKDLLEIFRKELQKPNGMIIVSGPTGSGKTTTLYAFLKEIENPEIKIITIEDPIEYHLEGISQTQVNPEEGYDFSSGLRSIMRQDPDAILVGEIRDLDTAEIAIQAALTGHLVLTTLHTNNAAGIVARLINLKAKPADIGPAVNLAVAQRLVRRVCKKCAKLKKISPQDLAKIRSGLKEMPGLIEIKKPGGTTKIPQAVGCKDCNSTGYRGRIGIFEAFLADSEVEKFILKNPSMAALEEMLVKKGMITLYQDGLIRVLAGITTLEEIERVTAEE